MGVMPAMPQMSFVWWVHVEMPLLGESFLDSEQAPMAHLATTQGDDTICDPRTL